MNGKKLFISALSSAHCKGGFERQIKAASVEFIAKDAKLRKMAL